MPRKCIACASPERTNIDELLASGAKVSEVSRRYGIGEDALTRHRRNHVTEPTPEPAPQAPAKRSASRTPEQLISDLESYAQEALDRAQDPNFKLSEVDRTRAATAALNALEKASRMRGTSREVSDAQLVKLPAFRRCTDAILAALRPHPLALAAVATALSELADSR